MRQEVVIPPTADEWRAVAEYKRAILWVRALVRRRTLSVSQPPPMRWA